MANTIMERLRHSWNAFFSREPTTTQLHEYAHYGSSVRPDRTRLYRSGDRSIVVAVFGRIAVDCASININHVKVDENDNFTEEISSSLNYIFSTEANIDQSSRQFIRDIVISMFDEGCIAVVPVDTNVNPDTTDSYDILSMRVGRIVEWFPYSVRVSLYNERIGQKQEVVVNKNDCAIIENPFYVIMNEPNSIYQRLLRVLNKLDVVNEQIAANKLDLILQLPYVIKSEARKEQAERRRRELEDQLAGSRYGVAYTDGTEKVIQLNRAVENNYWTQAKELMKMLYNQMGLTQEIFDGTADEAAMLNYYNRTIDPIMLAITEEFQRKFLTKTARTQGHRIKYFRDPFRLVPVSELANIADKFTRNEILTSNEVRSEIGYRPSDDPGADELRNKNLNRDKNEIDPKQQQPVINKEQEANIQNGE